MKLAMVISGFLGLIVVAALAWGFTTANFWEEVDQINNLTWGIITFIDFWAGVFMVALWMLYRENNKLVGVIWMLLLTFLGNFILAIYIIKNGIQSNGDWSYFFMGEKSS